MTWAKRITLVVTALVVALVVANVATAVTDEDLKDNYETRADWCESHGGQLVNEMALWHGGLACQFSDGLTVRLANGTPDNVPIEVDEYPDDPSAPPCPCDTPHPVYDATPTKD